MRSMGNVLIVLGIGVLGLFVVQACDRADGQEAEAVDGDGKTHCKMVNYRLTDMGWLVRCETPGATCFATKAGLSCLRGR